MTIFRDRRFWRFIAIGGTCFLTNVIILFVGTGLFSFHYLLSSGFSILFTNAIGWALNRTWTFASRSLQAWREFLRYLSVNLSVLLLNVLVMAVLVTGLHVHYLVASSILALIFAVASFVLHRDWSFRQ